MLNWRIENAKEMERGDLIEMKDMALEGRVVNRICKIRYKDF